MSLHTVDSTRKDCYLILQTQKLTKYVINDFQFTRKECCRLSLEKEKAHIIYNFLSVNYEQFIVGIGCYDF